MLEADTYRADLPDASIASRGFFNRFQLYARASSLSVWVRAEAPHARDNRLFYRYLAVGV
jgi:hypothetical protein